MYGGKVRGRDPNDPVYPEINQIMMQPVRKRRGGHPQGKQMAALFSVALLGSVLCANGWILSSTFPVDHSGGDSVFIGVTKLTSIKTQVPYDYYHLPFPKPLVIIEKDENLGEIMLGDKVESSLYNVKVLEDSNCKLLGGSPIVFSDKDKELFISMIEDSYRVNWVCENLPVESNFEGVNELGFPVGIVRSPTSHWLTNHVDITIRYHKHNNKDNEIRIVGFEAKPDSILHKKVEKDGTDVYECSGGSPLILEEQDSCSFTYSVTWIESPVEWASRWSSYMRSQDVGIHWLSIVNSLVIVMFLSGMVAMILLRTLLRDIARYNELDNLEEAQEESGWKLVHGDVFRRPYHSRMLAVCAGTGCQILGMLVVLLLVACMGEASPDHQGSLLQVMLILFALMGLPAGCVSARFNKLFQDGKCTRSLTVTLLTALLFPGFCFATFFILNLCLWSKGSSGAVHFGPMFWLLSIWLGISLPLVFVGSAYGYRKPVISLPVRTNQIPRQIPPQYWITSPFVSSVVGGILPFGAVFTELLFVMSSIWQHEFYYVYGFLLIVLTILVITSAEISIAFTYFQLVGEDYNWWWRSYWTSAFSAVYVFLYSILYFFWKLNITKVLSVLLYFGYMFLMSYAFFLLTGAVGFVTTFIFVRSIYGSIKVD